MTEGQINILILDDDKEELEIIQYHFDKSGITNYKMFTDIEEFFSNFNDDVYLAVCDYRLGGRTAAYVADRIQEICSHRDTLATCEVIIISATTDIRVPVYFLNSKKANYFLLKDNEGEYYYELVVYAHKAIERQSRWAELEKKQKERVEKYEEILEAFTTIPNDRK